MIIASIILNKIDEYTFIYLTSFMMIPYELYVVYSTFLLITSRKYTLPLMIWNNEDKLS